MNESFEDLANAGLPDEFPKPSRHWPRRLFLVGVAVCIVWAGVSLYFEQANAPRPLPESAKRLIVLEGEVPAEGVLPHQIDDATEFEASFGNLKEGFEAPKFREAVLVGNGEEVPALSATESLSDVVAKPRHVVLLEPAELPQAEPAAVVKTAAPPSVEVRDLSSDALVDIQFDRDWEGLVLVPSHVKLARAYTSDVRLQRVEAHPIDGGRLRVWSRIENLTDRDMFVETACEFRFAESGVAPFKFRLGMIPAKGALDVYHVSPREGVDSYTLMVKQ